MYFIKETGYSIRCLRGEGGGGGGRDYHVTVWCAEENLASFMAT